METASRFGARCADEMELMGLLSMYRMRRDGNGVRSRDEKELLVSLRVRSDERQGNCDSESDNEEETGNNVVRRLSSRLRLRSFGRR